MSTTIGSGTAEGMSPWAGLGEAIGDSLTPSMIERLATLISGLAELGMRMNQSEVRGAVVRIMDQILAVESAVRLINQWQHDGTWDNVTEVAALGAAVKDAASPMMTARLAELAGGLGELGAEASAPETRNALKRILHELPAIEPALALLAQWQRDGTLDKLAELAALGIAVKDAAGPMMVARLAERVNDLGQLAERLTGTDTKTALEEVLQELPALVPLVLWLKDMQADGTFTALKEMLSMAAAIKDAFNPVLAGRIAGMAEEIGSLWVGLRQSGLPTVMPQLLQALRDARQDAVQDGQVLGIVKLAGRLKDPKIQQGTKMMLAFVARLPDLFGEESQAGTAKAQ